jgi:hypothetical protein
VEAANLDQALLDALAAAVFVDSTTTTSTTTSAPATTTTTTTIGITCENWNLQALSGTVDTVIQYYDCTNVLHTVTLMPEEFLGCTPINAHGFGPGNLGSDRWLIVSGPGYGSETPC